MAEDHLLFLREKFMEDLKEAEEEFNEIPLLPHFQAISEVLTPCWITSSTPIKMKDSLYDLKFALAECVMLAEKEIDRRSQKRKIQVDTHFVKKHWFLFCTRRKLLHIKKKLLQLYQVNPSLESTIQSSVHPEASVTDHPGFDTSRIHGFDCHLQQIEEMLLKPDSSGFKAIGIVGIGGSGKTALAQLVFHSARVRKSFSPMLWVQANAHARPRDIESSIVEHMARFGYGEYEENCLREDGGILRDIWHYLENTRYLIVVDNLWHGSDDEMDPISSPYFCRGLPKEEGGAIIVTSRMEEEVRKMVGGDSPDLHLIEPVMDRESWFSIVMESTPMLDYSNPTHILIRDEIAERCDGLPLAAKTLAEIVSTNFASWTYIPSVIQRFVVRVDLYDDKSKRKVLMIVCELPGVDYVAVDMKEKKLTVVGTVDPVIVVSKLRKFLCAEIILVGPAKEPEKKEEQKKDQAKKEKFILKLDLHDDIEKRKALKIVSALPGVDYVAMDMKDKKLTVVGTVDPVSVVSKLRKFWPADIILGGPAKEPEKKEEQKKDEAKKEEEKKKEEGKEEDGKKEEDSRIEEGKKEEEKKKEPEPGVGFMP